MMFLRKPIIILILLFSGICVQGQEIIYDPSIELSLPLNCTPDETCWVVNYSDLASDENIKDYMGGSYTYKGSLGTDFALQSLLNIQTGKSVFAAQDGTIIFVKNDVKDNIPIGENEEETTPLGNMIIIEHNRGWKTIYAHLKKDSISLKQGDFASRGQKIGEIGYSGQTNFPHLFFAVSYDGNYYDPFSGRNLSNPTENTNFGPLWQQSTLEQLLYREVAVVNIGVAKEEPTLETVKEGLYQDIEILNDVESLFPFIYGFHIQNGDYIKIDLKDPEANTILSEVKEISSTEIENLITFSKKKETERWLPGTYNGKIEVIRPEKKLVYEYDFNFQIKELPKIKTEEEKRLERIKKLRRRRMKRIKIKMIRDQEKNS